MKPLKFPDSTCDSQPTALVLQTFIVGYNLGFQERGFREGRDDSFEITLEGSNQSTRLFDSLTVNPDESPTPHVTCVSTVGRGNSLKVRTWVNADFKDNRSP
jgi:hypothetical protein